MNPEKELFNLSDEELVEERDKYQIVVDGLKLLPEMLENFTGIQIGNLGHLNMKSAVVGTDLIIDEMEEGIRQINEIIKERRDS